MTDIPPSRHHTATAQTVLAALVRGVELPQLVLSDLSDQRVEGILHSLDTHREGRETEERERRESERQLEQRGKEREREREGGGWKAESATT